MKFRVYKRGFMKKFNKPVERLKNDENYLVMQFYREY